MLLDPKLYRIYEIILKITDGVKRGEIPKGKLKYRISKIEMCKDKLDLLLEEIYSKYPDIENQ